MHSLDSRNSQKKTTGKKTKAQSFAQEFYQHTPAIRRMLNRGERCENQLTPQIRPPAGAAGTPAHPETVNSCPQAEHRPGRDWQKRFKETSAHRVVTQASHLPPTRNLTRKICRRCIAEEAHASPATVDKHSVGKARRGPHRPSGSPHHKPLSLISY